MLLADHRMPGMTGVEFLEQARQFYPKARRVLLTAYADTDAAIAAINRADVDYYLLKPWDPPQEKLYPVLDDLLEDWKMHDRLKSDDRIRVVGHRWSAPSHVAQGLLDPQSGALQVVRARARRRGGPAAGGQRRRRRVSAAGRHRHGPALASSVDGRGRPGAGAVVDALAPLLRPHRDRGRSGRPRGRRLRGVGGPAHRAGRARSDRRTGRPELEDRELPGLPVGHRRRRPGLEGDHPGSAVRRRDAAHLGGLQPGGVRVGPGRRAWPTAASSRPTP